MSTISIDVLLEILLGIYLGLLTGIVPAFVAGALGFLVRYVTGVTLPAFGVVVLALSIAAVNGGLLALTEPRIVQSPRLLVAVLVVLMLSLYAHNQGDKLGTTMPRRVSLTSLRKRTLSADVVEFVGSVGQVTVRPTGEIHDVEGYPPLPAALRDTLRNGSWRLPADLPLSELESRLEERLRSEHDLADVSVSIDGQARAKIAAAPPSSGLSKRVPEGHRAVSIATLVPTGLARGDEVVVETSAGAVSGTVLSARTEADEVGGGSPAPSANAEPDVAPASDPTAAPSEAPPTPKAARTAGGEGRITVAVPRRDARTLLGARAGRIVVEPSTSAPAFEALSLVKRGGKAIRKVTVGPGGVPPDAADVDGITVLAVRRADADRDDDAPEWTFPRGGDESRVVAGGDVGGSDGPALERSNGVDGFEPGDQAFVAGDRTVVERFAEVVGR